MSTFSTSTPARSLSPRPHLDSFVEQSPISPRIATQPASQGPVPSLHLSQQALETGTNIPGADAPEVQEEDSITAARACFEAREFYRATHILEKCTSAKAKFLRIYCQFIVSYRSIY